MSWQAYRTSKPPTHSVSAAQRIKVRGSNPPVMAIHAAEGDGHGGGTCCDHGDYHPCELTERWPTVMGGTRAEQCPSQGERQGKHGVLEFDHFEHDFDAVGPFHAGNDAGC